MMQHLYFKTHWTPEDAHLILSFLDELRDLIWTAYGSEIIEFYNAQSEEKTDYHQQDLFPF